ncbi:histamine H2 receptor [Linepithema humile]|uniref:histamine H2 receptor n=1 Tax=Linepithema humile TaxID=83485 RepID=UPI00062375BF|nr:PREDICTED: octopamine receptor 1 [Linepithema humile]XP_012219299.1 PREDICTED: octopamine receptor 1 [Linepithema humile]XP_012219300.1 PREDICTED: octopamine receptor 1 [Linepithema humile]XP_012219301.1 PREDICTED: octopamine receptor 1 [Linepithema humile]
MYLKSCNVVETNENEPVKVEDDEVFWIIMDCFLFIVIVLGNTLTILAISWARRLRNVISNYFILNLAMSDLLVGVTLLYNLAIYVDNGLYNNKPLCIWYIVTINLACGGSMLYLIAIAVDRYVAIVHPLSYNAYITRKRALLVIIVIWILITAVSAIPIYWNCSDADVSWTQMCETILPKYYKMGIQMPSFCLSWIAMLLLYWKIWKEAKMHARRMNLTVVSNIADHKNVQVMMLMLILGCFSICWLPYFVVASMVSFGVNLDWSLKLTFTLATANSGMNPFIYAWKNSNFRRAFQKMLHLKSPNDDLNWSFKMYLEKQHKLNSQQIENGQRINRNGSLHGSFNAQSNRAETNGTNNFVNPIVLA